MNKQPTHRGPAELVREVYQTLASAVATMTDERSWLPTDCAGWAARDLVFHCLSDAQRGLVALHTPAGAPADRDAISYWSDWQPEPGGAGAANGRRFTRVVSSMFLTADPLRELFLETTAAVAHAAARTDPGMLVATQGHVLTAGDLLSTLAVEATIHHLDLTPALCGAPTAADTHTETDTETQTQTHAETSAAPTASAAGLAEVRRVLDGLLGRPVPIGWDTATYARKATGRLPLTPEERQALDRDALADRFPLFC